MWKEKTLAIQLIRSIFLPYFMVAILVTIIQVYIEFKNIKKTVLQELVNTKEVFQENLSYAYWTINKEGIEYNLKGIVTNSAITGIDVIDLKDRVKYSLGETDIKDKKAKLSFFDSWLSKQTKHRFALRLEIIKNKGIQTIGWAEIYTNNNVVFQRVKHGLILIIINSFIKTLLLWLIVYYFIMKIVAKPMNKLNSKISSLNFSNLKQIDLKLFYENELSRFLRTLNILIKRLQSHHADLEKKVKERTEDLKIKNLELKLSNNKLESFSKIINQYIISSVTDIHGNIIEVSDAFCKISGYSRDELLGNNLNMLKNVDSTSCEDIIVSLNENKVWYGELKSKKKNGEYYWVDATITPIFDENNNKIGYTFIRQDITDKKVIEKLSITDGLTAIYNRRYFNELFPKVLASSKRDKELISFLIMDIDFFKQYNDTYGHQMGDEVLVKLARVLKNSLNRVDDYCFRIGGEEFALLFRSETKEHALNFANKIRQDIENLKIDHEQNTASRYVTVSMGLVTKNSQNILDTEAIYKEADDLLYKAKRAGKNQVFF